MSKRVEARNSFALISVEMLATEVTEEHEVENYSSLAVPARSLSASNGRIVGRPGGDVEQTAGAFEMLLAPGAGEQSIMADAVEPAGQGVEATVILNGPTVTLACLVVDSGSLAGKVFTLTDGLSLGRQADNDIVITDPGVSRRHARFTRDAKGVWSVADLGSSNGCFVNEARIEGPTVLQPGDHIRVSNTTMTFNPSGE